MFQRFRPFNFSMAMAFSIQIAFYFALCVQEISAASTDPVPPRFFGMHSMAVIPAKPYGLFRTWDCYYSAGPYTGDHNWKDLEPSKGTYVWRALDDLVNALAPQGVDILYCFGKTPSWAAAQQTDPPANIQDWDDFVTAFVNRYHSSIKYLECWNESAPQEGFFTGTYVQLAQLAQHLYTITKSIDTSVKVLTPDATGGAYNMSQFYPAYFAAGGGAYADIVAFHGYPSMAGINVRTQAEEILSIVTALKAAMNSNGQGAKPIFDTECSWGNNGNQPTDDGKVAFLARHYLLQWSSGVSMSAWYCWDCVNWGDLLSSGTRSAAGIAYQQLFNWMVGATMTQPCTAQGSVYTCAFTRPGGYQALAVWDTNSAATSTFTVPNGCVQYRDLAGNSGTAGGTVTIGIKPILLENMNPAAVSQNWPKAARAAQAAEGDIAALYNMRGQMLIRQTSRESVMRDMRRQALPKGVYLMHVQTAGQTAANHVVCLP
ncbi:MAG TPA: T9SS type A sorting domain-containing protein [Chitinivibrionales bacterium]|nr:T9SS type A sorting domain-containing protein [Chitinivibrionales bacterium]